MSWLNRFNNTPDVDAIRAKYAEIYKSVQEMEGEALRMRQTFADGGDITWEQLSGYEIATEEKPIGYPTGKNCVSYRLPGINNCLVFRTVCVAPNGQFGRFGWHWHPETRETNIQLDGYGIRNNTRLHPYAITVFEPDEPHDYTLSSGGSLITVFERVK